MNQFRLFILTVFMAMVCSATRASACDDYSENGGFIFLKTALVSNVAGQMVLNVEINADDYNRLIDLVPKCDLAVYVRFPSMRIKIRKSHSKLLFGFEPRYARFVEIISR